MMRIRKCLVAVTMFTLVSSVRAGDYTFDIPQLLGHYLGDIPAIPTHEVEVNLGMEFAQIQSASLQLSGTHTPGLAGDLNSSYTYPMPAEVVAWSDRAAPIKDVIIDQFLPASAGQFVFDEPFRTLGPPGGIPDFSPWLDGGAEFQFSMHTPMMLAIYYLIDMPSVTITSATLVIQGQPNLDVFMLPGDFDGSGSVDGKDLLAWQRSPSVGVLSDWQASYGEGVLATVAAIPEPTTFVLAIMAVTAVIKRKSWLTT